MPGCRAARARPAGGHDGHALERCGARCPARWQGSVTNGNQAPAIDVRAPGVRWDQAQLLGHAGGGASRKSRLVGQESRSRSGPHAPVRQDIHEKSSRHPSNSIQDFDIAKCVCFLSILLRLTSLIHDFILFFLFVFFFPPAVYACVSAEGHQSGRSLPLGRKSHHHARNAARSSAGLPPEPRKRRHPSPVLRITSQS